MQRQLMRQQSGSTARCSRAAPVTRARAVRVAAKQTTTPSKTGGKIPGFKWDPGMQRWVRSKNDSLVQDASATLITPMTGMAYQPWPVVWATLTDAGLESIDASKAYELQQKGWTLVDVRTAEKFERSHPAGAVSLPLYRPVQGSGFMDNVKKVVMKVGFAMTATERNPDFQELVKQRLRKDQKVIVICDLGGTLDTNVKYRREKKIFADPDRAFGRESRSLKAAYEFLEAGWSPRNVLHCEGGLGEWRVNGLPLDSGAD